MSRRGRSAEQDTSISGAFKAGAIGGAVAGVVIALSTIIPVYCIGPIILDGPVPVPGVWEVASNIVLVTVYSGLIYAGGCSFLSGVTATAVQLWQRFMEWTNS